VQAVVIVATDDCGVLPLTSIAVVPFPQLIKIGTSAHSAQITDVTIGLPE